MISQEDKLFEILMEKIKSYHPSNDVEDAIRTAYQTAKIAHQDQKRKSGEPFIIHPLETAMILADLKCDKETIIAGLLHDTIEDTAIEAEKIEAVFGSEILFLVQGLTKLEQLSTKLTSEQLQIDNIKKILLAMANDIRVILIKLADRLHNMRTLDYQSRNKQVRIAQETLDIYAPIAGRLGIYLIQSELEDLALKYLKPGFYEQIKGSTLQLKKEHEKELHDLCNEISLRLTAEDVANRVYVFYDHIFNIYRRIVKNHGNADAECMYETCEIKIEVSGVMECYKAIGILHDLYKPVPGKFKDHIAIPKSNLYRALHTRILAGSGSVAKIHIMTSEMDRVNEYGIACYWKYRDDASGLKEIKIKEKLDWLKDILEWQLTEDDSKFMQLLKNDFNLYDEKIYCFTPKGKVIELPAHSVAVDFAYQIHSDIGDHITCARINNVEQRPDCMLKKGDVVEIQVSDQSRKPSIEWIGKVKTSKAKIKILQAYKTRCTEKSIELGKKIFDDICLRYNFGEIKSNLLKTELCKRYRVNDWNVLLSGIGFEEIKPVNILEHINALELISDETIYDIRLKTKNRVGLLADIANCFSERTIDIKWLEMNVNAQDLITVNIKILMNDPNCDIKLSELKKELGGITGANAEIKIGETSPQT